MSFMDLLLLIRLILYNKILDFHLSLYYSHTVPKTAIYYHPQSN